MKHQFLIAALALAAGALHAQTVDVRDAWARATVPGQKATGVYMKLTARESVRLVGVSSPVAGVGEVHQMKLEDGVMMMRPMDALELPAGKTVELRPGGYHMMLLDLKAPLAKDGTVPLTLTFRDAKGRQNQLELQVPVAQTAPGAQAPDQGGMGGHGPMRH